MENKIAFVITTFMRDALLYKSIDSLLPFLQENWKIIIIDQGELSEEKFNWLESKGFESLAYSQNNQNQQLFYYQVPFDSGLSYCRNYGVTKAKEIDCKFTVISSDSFLVNDSITRIDDLTYITRYDLIGFELSNCVCGWEAILELNREQGFVLDFIKKDNTTLFYDCDIVRNFFVAKTDALYNTKWDENLKLAEHESFFFEFKKNKYKVGWTNTIDGTKQTERPDEYAKLRKTNFDNGIRYLRQKYNIKKWVTYKNLKRAKEFYGC